MAKIKGAAKKAKEAAIIAKANSVGAENAEQMVKFAEKELALVEAIENDQEVTFTLVKADKNVETPATLIFKQYNTLNKVIMTDAEGNDVVLIRTNVGKKLPQEYSNFFRISKTTARYAVVAEGEATEDEAEEAE